MFHIIPIKALKDNYIWCVMNNQTHKCIVVDPGEANPIHVALKQFSLTLDGILITHHHWDHTGGVSELITHYKIPVYGPNHSQVHGISVHLNNGDRITILDSLQLEIIAIPGHTLDHIAYYGNNWLFCGDTLFGAGCGRIFEGTVEQMFSSLEKLKALPDSTEIYCGHEYTVANLNFAKTVEPNNQKIQQRLTRAELTSRQGNSTLPSTIALEKETNPFFRSTESEIISSVNHHENAHMHDPVDIFQYTRAWKDHF